MSDFTLTSAPPLAGYNRQWSGVTLRAPADLAIVSLALPFGAEDAAKKAVKAAYGVDLPAVSKFVSTADKTASILRLSLEQAFVLFPHPTPEAEPVVAARLKGTAYTTDQTDVWTSLELSGPKARAVLERICPIDLHADAFAVNDAARTVMEHLGTIIVRTDADTFLLLSASSSATSFVHAVETSIANVL